MPELAKITWQDQKPFNLNTFQFNKIPYNLPYRISNKMKRIVKQAVGKPFVQRNWELQFVGLDNEARLKNELFKKEFENLVPKHIIKDYYELFLNGDKVYNAHAINMLLVLSKFNQMFIND